MKTLVTGASGFIGSYLVRALLREGREVRCLVREASDTRRLEGLNIDYVKGDICDKQALEKAVQGIGNIFHLAGIIRPGGDRAGVMQKVNAQGTRNLIDACLNKRIEKFVFLSSLAACGPAVNMVPLRESGPCRPITAYGKSKYEAETMLLKAARDCNFPSIIIRPSNTYGPMGINGYMPLLIKAINKGLFFTPGSGSSKLSFCYIDNLIEGVLLAEENKRSTGEVYFISDEAPYTLNSVITAIAREEQVLLRNICIPLWAIYGATYPIDALSGLFGHSCGLTRSIEGIASSYWICDIAKARKELGFSPKIGLNEGIRRTVEWFRKQGRISGK